VRLVTILVIAHIVALLFGLAGLLIAVPNPHLWADSDLGVQVYRLGMSYAGAIHILFATAAMLLIGYLALGLRRTAIFLGITVVISLGAELLGTTTGFPFGPYSYTSGLGYKLFGEVPFTIPLSWFYMGLASYILAIVLVGRRSGTGASALAVVIGAALLTIWDLVLDPAMAHQQLDVRFWVWQQEGLYFGMPAQNFLGWMLTGVLFIGLARIVWRSEPPVTTSLVRVSYAIYLANLVFAMAISGAVGLWWPVFITVVIGVGPATLALLWTEQKPEDTSGSRVSRVEDPVQQVSRRVMTTGAKMLLARGATRHVEGREHLPDHGPVLLVPRHFHHLYDGCVLLTGMNRHVHILVAIDWALGRAHRRLLDVACRVASWPTVVRGDQIDPHSPNSPDERFRRLRRALEESTDILANGGTLVVFPEGYPNIDPNTTPKSDERSFLPFERGFVRIVERTQRVAGIDVPILPVGFDYRRTGPRWEITMRIGRPVFRHDFESESDLIRDLEDRVFRLSQPGFVSQPSTRSTIQEPS
jgi:uncharacterized membrane protein/1-acyl-sn-glycerol-3-phosphate acyltransferase